MVKKSFFFYIGIACVAAVLVTSVYLGIQKNRLGAEVTKLEALAENRVPEGGEVDPFQILQAQLAQLDEEHITWSAILPEIPRIVPSVQETGLPIVIVSSITGTGGSVDGGGSIALTGRTQPGATTPLTDVASTLRSFVAHPALSNVFLATVARTADETGPVYTFSMTMSYKKPTL